MILEIDWGCFRLTRVRRDQKSIIFGIVVARCIALPLSLTFFVVGGAFRFGFIPHDPLYQFILLLQFTVSPAIYEHG